MIFFRKRNKKISKVKETDTPVVQKEKEPELKPGQTSLDSPASPSESETGHQSKQTETKAKKALEVGRRLVKQPLLTEKATGMEAEQKYVFQVDKKATKSEIKKEIERLFNVEVTAVNIINKKRKSRLWKGKVGWSKSMKKAIVTIAEGKKIEILPH